MNDSNSTEDDFKFICTGLCYLNIAQEIYETIFIEIDWKLRMHIVPNFWKYFQDKNYSTNNDLDFYQFQYAVCELEKDFIKFQNTLKRLQMYRECCQLSSNFRNEFDRFDEILRITLLSQLPANFERIIYLFYSKSIKVLINCNIGV